MFPFNVRVYGLLLHHNRVLISDEWIKGALYSKFPGGGLEWGEGTRDCLKREYQEELQLEVTVDDHFYTTDYFQPSAWNPQHQIISIYYLVTPATALPPALVTANLENGFTLPAADSSGERFRFVPIDDILPSIITLPIDKVVAQLLVTQRARV